jgi:hypothetical protein
MVRLGIRPLDSVESRPKTSEVYWKSRLPRDPGELR